MLSVSASEELAHEQLVTSRAGLNQEIRAASTSSAAARRQNQYWYASNSSEVGRRSSIGPIYFMSLLRGINDGDESSEPASSKKQLRPPAARVVTKKRAESGAVVGQRELSASHPVDAGSKRGGKHLGLNIYGSRDPGSTAVTGGTVSNLSSSKHNTSGCAVTARGAISNASKPVDRASSQTSLSVNIQQPELASRGSRGRVDRRQQHRQSGRDRATQRNRDIASKP